MKGVKLFDEFYKGDLDNTKPYEPLDGEWELDDIIAVSDEEPEDLTEAIVIGADFGNAKVARGKKIYITARISKREGELANRNQVAVIETRVVNIFQSLNILNQIKKT